MNKQTNRRGWITTLLTAVCALCCVSTAKGNMVAAAGVGDTLQCTVKFRGRSIADRFRYKKKYMIFIDDHADKGQADTIVFACDLSVTPDKKIPTPMDTLRSVEDDELSIPDTLSASDETVLKYWELSCIAILDSKDDSLYTYSIVHPKTDIQWKDWHVATITVNPYARTCEGSWRWYDMKRRMIHEEHYTHNAIQSCESYGYEPTGHITICTHYVYRKSDQREAIAIRYVKEEIFASSGEHIITAVRPRDRINHTAKGSKGYTIRPTDVMYFSKNGDTIQYANTEQVAKAVQSHIEKNFKSESFKPSGGPATATFDVIAAVGANGQITMLGAIYNDVYTRFPYNKDVVEMKKIRTAVTDDLRDYLRNNLRGTRLHAKPVLLEQQPVECILYFTVTIRMK